MLYIILSFIFVGFLITAYIFPILDLLLSIVTSKLSLKVNAISYKIKAMQIDFESEYGQSNTKAIGFDIGNQDMDINEYDDEENCEDKVNNKIGY
ncbi:MAG TPA: hypothetical protein VIK86_08015 [Candidatus Paceibacterota bacterium]